MMIIIIMQQINNEQKTDKGKGMKFNLLKIYFKKMVFQDINFYVP